MTDSFEGYAVFSVYVKDISARLSAGVRTSLELQDMAMPEQGKLDIICKGGCPNYVLGGPGG